MAFCVNCGTEITGDMKFCPKCGAPVGQDNVSSSNETQYNYGTTQEKNVQDDFQKKFEEINNTKDTTSSFDSQDITENKWMAFLAYWSILVLIPLFVAKDKSPFVKYHVNQGLVLLIAEIGISIIAIVLGALLFLVSLLVSLLELGLLALSIIGMINAYNGKAKELPFLGSIQILK